MRVGRVVLSCPPRVSRSVGVLIGVMVVSVLGAGGSALASGLGSGLPDGVSVNAGVTAAGLLGGQGLTGAEFEQARLAAADEAERDHARLATAGAVAERERSQDQFGDLSVAASLELDPVNFFVYPFARGDGGQFFDRIQTHFKQHWRSHIWKRKSEIGGIGCKGNTRMFFGNNASLGTFDTDEHGVGYRPQNHGIIPDECGDRWHTRLWSDEHVPHPHGGVTRDPLAHRGDGKWAESFAVGNVHREKQTGYLQPPCPASSIILGCRTGYSSIGHEIDLDWDDVEVAFLRQMRHTPRSPGHADAQGNANMGHCTSYRWRVLPGSRYEMYKFPSDGVMSRVSMLHCPKRTG